jgi:hypothetical protein
MRASLVSTQTKIEYKAVPKRLTNEGHTTIEEIDLIYARQEEVNIGTALKMPEYGISLVVNKKGHFVELLTVHAEFQTFNANYILKSWIINNDEAR